MQRLLIDVKLDPTTYQELGRDGVKELIIKEAHDFIIERRYAFVWIDG